MFHRKGRTAEQSPAKQEIATTDEIENEAIVYIMAASQARTADRAKRASRKLLDRLPAGRYGGALIERTPSGRAVVDREAVEKIFAAHGLGPVPMRQAADTLKVTWVGGDAF